MSLLTETSTDKEFAQTKKYKKNTGTSGIVTTTDTNDINNINNTLYLVSWFPPPKKNLIPSNKRPSLALKENFLALIGPRMANRWHKRRVRGRCRCGTKYQSFETKTQHPWSILKPLGEGIFCVFSLGKFFSWYKSGGKLLMYVVLIGFFGSTNNIWCVIGGEELSAEVVCQVSTAKPRKHIFKTPFFFNGWIMTTMK